MANRLYQQFHQSLDHGVVSIYGYVTVGAAGAVSAFKGLGISNVVETATGVYTVSIADSFPAFLGASAMVVFNGTSAVAAVTMKQAPTTDPGPLKSIVLNTLDFAGADVEPDNGARIYFEFKMRNSGYVPAGGV